MRANIPGLACVALAIGLIMPGAPARAQLTESPITPGFWTWPRNKLDSPQAITAQCREKFAVQFADGRYFGVRLRSEEKPLTAPTIDEVGHCRFNRESKVERCDLRVYNADGTVTVGIIESGFSFESDRTFKMSVTATVSSGNQPGTSTFDVFPVRCPDEAVWDALGSLPPAR